MGNLGAADGARDARGPCPLCSGRRRLGRGRSCLFPSGKQTVVQRACHCDNGAM